MDLHTPGKKADWDSLKLSERNSWQKIASATNGILTPSNLISGAGLILVIFGLFEIAAESYLSGSLLIAGGRLFDLLDGYVAELTKTKSQVGEMVDTTVDKLEVFTALIAITVAGALPIPVLSVMFLFSIWVSAAALMARHRRIDIHPSLAGKLATAAVWASIVLFLFSKASDQAYGWAELAAYGFFAVFIWQGFLSAFRYSRVAFGADITDSQLVKQFDNFVVVSNPKSSNAGRTLSRIKVLNQTLPKKPDVIRTTKDSDKLRAEIQSYIEKKSGQTLIFIGGGDGTVHEVINAVITSKNRKKAVVLPIWGGNANDFAYMLNGPSYKRTLLRVLKNGRVVNVNPLKITIRNKNKETVRYAACYTSFGVTAFVADKLNKRLPVKKNWFFNTPFMLTLQEIWSVTDSFKKAPVISANIDGQKVTVFEEAFMNGTRIAKINIVPMKLTDNAYYHAHQPNKHPLLSRRVIQALTGKKFGRITSKPTSFTLNEPAVGQFDGEVSRIDKGSKITVSPAPDPIRAISVKL